MKSLHVLQKARIKIVTRAIYTYLLFSYTYTLLFCWKTRSCCDNCFPQEITTDHYSMISITILFQYEDWFHYDQETPRTAYSIHHVSYNLLSFNHSCLTKS